MRIRFPLRITLPRTVVTTGYGVPVREGQDTDHFVGLAKAAGFQIVSRKDKQGWFMLEMKRGD